VAGAAGDRFAFSLFVRSKVTAAHRATAFAALVGGADPGLWKIRPHVGASLAAGRACEVWLKIG
jgi:hypothetical protein